tara:strand:+ start:939 stop:1658 length:720 start_codon:yes stop_codon:yes gene_type:complete
MQDYLCGCIGGIWGTLTSYPIDTLRIRLQSGIKSNRSLYSGVVSPMLGIGLEKALVFGIYNQTYKYTKNDFISGLNSGLFASLIVTPIEKFKILKQNNPKLTYYSITNELISKGAVNGTKSLFNGLSACFFREVPGYAIYFSTYNFLNKITKNNNNNLFKTLINGGASGVSAWLVIYPFDTIKTNMQQNNTKFIDTARTLIKDGRIYHGIHWSLMRAFTLHSCVFLGYELSKKYLFEEN